MWYYFVSAKNSIPFSKREFARFCGWRRARWKPALWYQLMSNVRVSGAFRSSLEITRNRGEPFSSSFYLESRISNFRIVIDADVISGSIRFCEEFLSIIGAVR